MARKAEQAVNVNEGSHVGTVTQIMRFGIPTVVILAVPLIAVVTVSGYNLKTIFRLILPAKPVVPIRLDVETTWDGPGTPHIALGDPRITQDDLMVSTESEYGIEFRTEDSFLLPLEDIGMVCANISLAITSQVEDEWIRVEPYPLIEILSVNEFDNQGKTVHIISPPTAGGGFETNYSASLASSSNSDRVQLQPDEPLPDFFTLQPGENEWFVIRTSCVEPGSYQLRVGVQYTYKGTQETIWSTGTITILEPSHACFWSQEVGEVGMDFFGGCGDWNQSSKQWEMDYPLSVDQWVVP